MGTRVSMLLVVLLLAGCATAGAPTTTGTPNAGNTPSNAPLPTIDEGGLVSGRLTCGEGDTFPAAALQGPGGSELGGDAAAAGLRAVLAEGADPQLPRSGWHRVISWEGRAQFVARGVGGSPWVVVVLLNSQSGWTMDLAGACRLAVVLGPGIGPASWWVDAAAGLPGPEATTIGALVQEQSCASGRPPDSRIAAPVVIYQADAVIVVFGVIPLAGGQDCQGVPPGRYRIVLTEPLGSRPLLDGGVVPPRDATRPPN